MRAPVPRCDRCDDVIGVYEPMIVVVRGEARQTSRAAEPSLAHEEGRIYHRECYFEHFAPAAG